MTDEPLIYTSKGNVPISSLTYEKAWDLTDPRIIFFYEWWKDEDGNVVKNNVHGCVKEGLVIGGEQAAM